MCGRSRKVGKGDCAPLAVSQARVVNYRKIKESNPKRNIHIIDVARRSVGSLRAWCFYFQLHAQLFLFSIDIERIQSEITLAERRLQPLRSPRIHVQCSLGDQERIAALREISV